LPGMQCSDEAPQPLQPSQLDPRKPCKAHARPRNRCNPRSLTRASLARLTQGPATVAGLGARGLRLATNARHERRPAPLGTLATWLATPRLPGCQIAGRAARKPLKVLATWLATWLATSFFGLSQAKWRARAPRISRRPGRNRAVAARRASLSGVSRCRRGGCRRGAEANGRDPTAFWRAVG
jgi:hypothetical protein